MDLPVILLFEISFPTVSVPYPKAKSVFPWPGPTVHIYVYEVVLTLVIAEKGIVFEP